jgi:flagellar hook-basal body complex protein FliE
MAFFPITPVSPELPLTQTIGASEGGLGPIPNVGDGIPGIGGIGSVELPGIGTLTPSQVSGLTSPQITIPSPAVSPAPMSITQPEVTPFPIAGPAPSAAPSGVTQTTTITQPQETGTQTQAQTSTQTQTQSGGQLQEPSQGSPYSTQPITTDTIAPLTTTPLTTQASVPVKDTPLAQTFGKYLQQAAANYTDTQNQASDLIQRMAAGDKVDISDVSLALQKASIDNQLAIQVRNKLVDAYQEIMRMQM